MKFQLINTDTLILIISYLIYGAKCVEFTFELPDNAKECFHEEIPAGTKSTLEFQVVTGGHYDVDVAVEGPNKQVLYHDTKQQYGQFEFTADTSGIYQVCFSNEFSTFSHKLVYMDFQIGDEPALPGVGEHFTAMTQMESSAQKVHEDLNSIIDYQTHHRLKESQGRKRAEELGDQVLLWSIIETLGILLISMGQVVILRSFFADKNTYVQINY